MLLSRSLQAPGYPGIVSTLQTPLLLCLDIYIDTHFQFTKKYLVRIQASDDWISPWCDNKKLTFQL